MIKKELNDIDEQLEVVKIQMKDELTKFKLSNQNHLAESHKYQLQLEYDNEQLQTVEQRCFEVDNALAQLKENEHVMNPSINNISQSNLELNLVKQNLSIKELELEHRTADRKQLQARQAMLDEDIHSKQVLTADYQEKIEFKQGKLEKKYKDQYLAQAELFTKQRKKKLLTSSEEELNQRIQQFNKLILNKEQQKEEIQLLIANYNQQQQSLVDKQRLVEQQSIAGFSLYNVPSDLKKVLDDYLKCQAMELVQEKVKTVMQVCEDNKQNLTYQQAHRNQSIFKYVNQKLKSLGSQDKQSVNKEQLISIFAKFDPKISQQDKQAIKTREEQLADIKSHMAKLTNQIAYTQDTKEMLDQEIVVDKQQLITLMKERENLITGMYSSNYADDEIPQDLKVELNAINRYSDLIDFIHSIEIPSLHQFKDHLSKFIKEQTLLIDNLHIEIANMKDTIQEQDTDERNHMTMDQVNYQSRLLKLETLQDTLKNKKAEMEERVKYQQEQLLNLEKEGKHKGQLFVEEQHTRQQNLNQLVQRQSDLILYMQQLESVIKPSILELQKQIYETEQAIQKQKSSLIRIQKLSNLSQKEHDYQQLSHIKSINLLTQFNNNTVDQDSLKSPTYSITQAQEIKNFEVTVDVGNASPSIQEISQIMYYNSNDPTNEYFSITSHQHNPTTPTQVQHLLKTNPLSDKEQQLILKLKPLIDGMDVYKKTFDTRLISVSTQSQRFNPLQANKRISPDHEGYIFRRVKMNKTKLWHLDIINPHDENRIEGHIDMKQAKLSIPKATADSLKFQKEDRQVASILLGKTQVQQKKHQTFVQQEKSEYVDKCLKAEFYSLQFICADKEVDILVPGVGSFYNYIYLKSAIDALIDTPIKTLEKIKYHMV